MESVRSLRIKDINAHVQVHGIAGTDSLAQTSQCATDSGELFGTHDTEPERPHFGLSLHQLEERFLPDVGAESLDQIGELPFAS